MNLYLEKASKEEWSKLSHDVHMTSFGESRPADQDRIDYALVIRNDDAMCGYATIIEIDKSSAYMQHGGAFPAVKDSPFSIRCYFMMMNWLKEHYDIISTRILNKNTPMVKFALTAGLEINGIDVVDGNVFLNLFWKKNVS